MAGMRAQTRASRAAVLALLVLACARGGDEERKAHGTEHDEWHPRRFAQTPAPLSTSHAAAVTLGHVRARSHQLSMLRAHAA